MTGKQLKMSSRGNSSSKPDRTGRDGNVAKQSKTLNYSAYSRLGNKMICDLLGALAYFLTGFIQVSLSKIQGL